MEKYSNIKKIAVIALGGNAIIRSNEEGTIDEQVKNTKETLRNLIFLLKEGYSVVITHGNGPQVGNILMRNDAGESKYKIPQMPIDICVADSQGGIGYMIERSMRNVLKEEKIERDVITVVTQVVIDKADPAFTNPTKRIGKVYSKKQSEELSRDKGWIFKKSDKKEDGYRRVVASPMPIQIFNRKTIGSICREGAIVIASGGGGIPVSIDENNMIKPVEAVIDKDLASSLLATQIKADEFFILTDVPFVFANYNKPNEKKLEFLDYADTTQYLKDGYFGEGNMTPKIKAALSFIKNGGSKSVITEASKLADKSFGTKITMSYEL